MAKIHLGDIPEGTKRCIVCFEPINVQARRCIHCQSDQLSTLRRLGLSTTVLSLLVALVSVLSFAVPVITAALTPSNSDLVASFQAADGVRLDVIVSNKGTRPGTVRGAEITFPENQTIHLNIINQESFGRNVKAGDSVLIAFEFVNIAEKVNLKESANGTSPITLDTTNFRGECIPVKIQSPCDWVIGFARPA
jgi:hypothetical protein